jgi:hypothetical protein
MGTMEGELNPQRADKTATAAQLGTAIQRHGSTEKKRREIAAPRTARSRDRVCKRRSLFDEI